MHDRIYRSWCCFWGLWPLGLLARWALSTGYLSVKKSALLQVTHIFKLMFRTIKTSGSRSQPFTDLCWETGVQRNQHSTLKVIQLVCAGYPRWCLLSAPVAKCNIPLVSIMGWDGKAMKILNNPVIPLRAGASKQIGGIFQLFTNGKCSLHIRSFQQKGLVLPFFIIIIYFIIFTRKPEMTLLISAQNRMIPALPLSEPFSLVCGLYVGSITADCHEGTAPIPFTTLIHQSLDFLIVLWSLYCSWVLQKENE